MRWDHVGHIRTRNHIISRVEIMGRSLTYSVQGFSSNPPKHPKREVSIMIQGFISLQVRKR